MICIFFKPSTIIFLEQPAESFFFVGLSVNWKALKVADLLKLKRFGISDLFNKLFHIFSYEDFAQDRDNFFLLMGS